MVKDRQLTPTLKLFGEWYKQKQTAGTSTAAPVLRDGPAKEKAAPRPAGRAMRSSGRFMEALPMPGDVQGAEASPRRFKVVLLEEGLGNLGTCYYYTAEAIQSAPKIFEGAQFYTDHPSELEDRDRPERSVKDIGGYFENLGVVKEADGRHLLVGDLVVLAGQEFDRARALMSESIQYAAKHPGRELVGLSINAEGTFEEMALENLLKDGSVPKSAIPKLLEAQEAGVSAVYPVKALTHATSCDLVTVAGAGGRVATILEKEKKMGKEAKKSEELKKKGLKEAEAEEGKEKEAEEGKQAADAPGDGEGQETADDMGDHPDAEQDKELILKMLKKHLGDGFSEEDQMMMKQAYEAALEMCGGDAGEAEKCAAYNMKMAKHLAAKEKAGNPAGVEDPKPVPHDQQVEAKEGSDMNKLNEAEKKITQLTGEVAGLKAKLEERELKDHVDKLMRESKLPNAATKKFRECVSNCKTQKEVEEKFNVFKEAYSLRGSDEDTGFIVSAEKQSGESGGAEGFDVSDCMED